MMEARYKEAQGSKRRANNWVLVEGGGWKVEGKSNSEVGKKKIKCAIEWILPHSVFRNSGIYHLSSVLYHLSSAISAQVLETNNQ